MIFRKKKKAHKQHTTKLGKIWHFIWHDNSIWSWIANIIIAFVLIKFIIYPGLGLIMGTGLPVVAVVSESMDHNYVKAYAKEGASCTPIYKLCNDISPTPKSTKGYPDYWKMCGEWYEEKGITKTKFLTYTQSDGFSKGDIIVLMGKEAKEIKVGDIIVFASGKPYPIIHRVVKKTQDTNTGKYTFETKGDHNSQQIQDRTLDETKISEDNILGVAVGKIPLLGWVKIGLVDLLNPAPKC